MPKAEARDSGPTGDAQREIAQTRRALLGTMAALPVAAAPAAAAEPDPHQAWLEEYHALVVRIWQAEDDWGTILDGDAYDQASAVEDRILETVPSTLAGVAAQLMILVEAMHRGSCFGDQVTSPVLARAAELLPAPGWIGFEAGSA